MLRRLVVFTVVTAAASAVALTIACSSQPDLSLEPLTPSEAAAPWVGCYTCRSAVDIPFPDAGDAGPTMLSNGLAISAYGNLLRGTITDLDSGFGCLLSATVVGSGTATLYVPDASALHGVPGVPAGTLCDIETSRGLVSADYTGGTFALAEGTLTAQLSASYLAPATLPIRAATRGSSTSARAPPRRPARASRSTPAPSERGARRTWDPDPMGQENGSLIRFHGPGKRFSGVMEPGCWTDELDSHAPESAPYGLLGGKGTEESRNGGPQPSPPPQHPQPPAEGVHGTQAAGTIGAQGQRAVSRRQDVRRVADLHEGRDVERRRGTARVRSRGRRGDQPGRHRERLQRGTERGADGAVDQVQAGPRPAREPW